MYNRELTFGFTVGFAAALVILVVLRIITSVAYDNGVARHHAEVLTGGAKCTICGEGTRR